METKIEILHTAFIAALEDSNLSDLLDAKEKTLLTMIRNHTMWYILARVCTCDSDIVTKMADMPAEIFKRMSDEIYTWLRRGCPYGCEDDVIFPDNPIDWRTYLYKED